MCFDYTRVALLVAERVWDAVLIWSESECGVTGHMIPYYPGDWKQLATTGIKVVSINQLEKVFIDTSKIIASCNG